MLAVITHNGTSLIDPSSFKNPSNSFPVSTSLQCSMNVWSPDRSQLYLADSSSIKRYNPSECLLEELYCGSDAVTCLAMKEKNSILFFAAANKVWSLDCTQSSGELLYALEPHKQSVTSISISNDEALLASVSASAVFVHNLMLSSYTRVRGLPEGKPITCCLFHPHSKTRLLLAIERDVFVYDSTKPSGPLKTVRIPGVGNIVDIASSPFSKTLVAAATSSGDVSLVDIDKDNGILKNVNVKTPLTCCAFTPEGAAIYLGAESGSLLILNLRSLEKEPSSFIIGDGSAPIKRINVQGKSKRNLADNANAKTSSNLTTSNKLSSHSVHSSRMAFAGSTVVSHGAKSPVRTTVASKSQGVKLNRKLFSPLRTPLSETKNSGLDASSRSPPKPLRLQRSKERENNREAKPRLPSYRCHESTSYKMGQGAGAELLGLGTAPESISGHLETMRVRSGSYLSNGATGRHERDGAKTRSRRVVSESVKQPSKVSSTRATDGVVAHMQQRSGQRSTTPDNSGDCVGLSSPELPREPVTPISLGKSRARPPITSATGSSIGLTSPEVARWIKRESQNGERKDKAAEGKKARFALDPGEESAAASDESEDEVIAESRRADEQEQELSVQLSPRRPTATPIWLQSPHRPSAANLNMNAAAQDFLRNIVHDVMYDFQRETKAEMMGLHLDLVRMGRGWKEEVREMMEEWSEEVRQLKTENKRLREENERLRGRY